MFDDYSGLCDLGARLAIDSYCVGARLTVRRLVGHSAYATVGAGSGRDDRPGPR